MAGFTSYLTGTNYDVINSMSFNFVMDIIDASAGNGSKTYDGPSMNYTAVQLVFNQGTGSRSFSYSQSGNTLNWSSTVECKIVVYAVPTSSAPYVGFQLYNSDGTVKIAPNYTPISLAQIIDVTPTKGQIITTNVTQGRRFIAFHRATSSAMSKVLLQQGTSNGKVSLNVLFADGTTPIRLYIFSDELVNQPVGGFFMYWNDKVVWHSNCLPLNIISSTAAQVTSSNPIACISCIGANLNPAPTPSNHDSIFLATAAGTLNSQYTCQKSGWEYVHNFNVSGPAPSGWTIPNLGYIDTSVYDQYYKQALGL